MKSWPTSNPVSRAAAARAFRALQVRNYRLYFAGQLISISGTAMQMVAQAWLIFQLTGSGLDLGAVAAVQMLPLLVGSPFAGLMADRIDKRQLMIVTQSLAGLLALLLGVLVATHSVRLWMIFVIAFALGCVMAFDGPARQVLAMEMVGPDMIGNAVSLNEVVINASRVFGPAIGGVLIARFGTAVCFLANAGSYLPAVGALMLIKPAELFAEPLVERASGQLRAGLRYARTTPIVRSLLFMAAASAVVFNFGVAWPLMAERVLHAGAVGYGAMVTAFGIGALVGAFIAASDLAPHGRRVRTLAVATSIAVLVSALVPNLASELVVEVATGLLSIWFIAVANATIQLRTTPAMRGRVMGLWSMALPGSTPLTSLIVGAVAEAFGGRAAFSLGGVGLLIALAFGWHALSENEDRVGWRRASPADLGV